MGLLLPSGVGPPFRPDQKVKLDKTEARRGGLSLRHGFLGYDVGCPAGHFSKSARSGAPPVFSVNV
jgi:hypothetical protein